MRRYLKNTKRLVKNTLVMLILGLILIASYYILGLDKNPFIYYASIVIVLMFGLHLWLILISLHLNTRKK